MRRPRTSQTQESPPTMNAISPNPVRAALRITINPTSNADRFGYQLTVPSMNGGTGVSVASVAVSLV